MEVVQVHGDIVIGDELVLCDAGGGGIPAAPDKPTVWIDKNRSTGAEAVVEWEHLMPKPTKYLVFWEPNLGDSPASTTNNEMVVKLEPGHPYLIHVMGVNQGEPGQSSDKLRYRSAPQEPTITEIYQETKDSIVVKFEDQDANQKRYKVTVVDDTGTQIVSKVSEKKYAMMKELKTGSQYEVFVQAFEDNGEFGIFESTKAYYHAPYKLRPPPPSGCKCESLERGGYKLSWDPVCGARRFLVKWSGGPDEPNSKEIDYTSCYLNADELKPGQHYEISVCPINDNGEAMDPTVLPFDTNPTPPYNIQVDVTRGAENSILVTFCDTAATKTSYIVEAVPHGEGVNIQVLTEKHSAELRGLLASEKYRIYVTARYEEKLSRKIAFEKLVQTPPTKPIELRVENHDSSPHDSIIVYFNDPNEPREVMHEVRVEAVTANKDAIFVTTTNRKVLVDGLIPGVSYSVAVVTIDGDLRSQPSYYGPPVTTYPAIPQGVELVHHNGKLTLTWQALEIKPSHYEVHGETNGLKYIKSTKVSEKIFTLYKLKLSTHYKFRVAAVNKAGRSYLSEEKSFQTAPSPPMNVRVQKNAISPTSSFIVKYEDPDPLKKSYEAFATSLQGEIVSRARSGTHTAVLNNLPAGRPHFIYVIAYYGDNMSERAYCCEEESYQTDPAIPQDVELVHQNGKLTLTWQALAVKPSHYEVQWEANGVETISKVSEETFTLDELMRSTDYTFRVAAVNKAGRSYLSEKKSYQTAPPTPVGLDAKILSTREIQAFCDDTYGASTYVFKIDGREHKTDQPTFTLHHSQLNKHIQIQVFAENKGGRSPPSSICECRQVLLQLQEKFLEKAKNFQDCKFITPKFKEVLSGNEAIDFGTEEFCVGKGKTVCVVGRDFSGKTSCCFQYLRSLSEHELGIYLDWDDYKDLKASLDIKSTLMRQMKDFGEIEKKFAIEWMRAHPDQVVFVVDNLVLPHSVAGKLKLWEDIATPQEIFYSLVIPTREIFPECQVLCATSQSDLRQIIKPNRTMAIIGFDEKHIKEMRGMILGEDCDIMLPTHLEYFCKNPAYCKIIFCLLKNPDANVDMESYSSILLKLISESVSCYPEGKMKEKLRHLKDEVKNVPQKLRITKVDPSKVKKRTKLKSESATTHRSLTNASEVPSFIEILEENWQRNHSCEALHDYIIKAIFFGLFCPLNEFKNRFHKKSIKLGVNANIWILAAGLLREETVNLAADLFSAIDEKLNVKEIAKKLDFTKTFAQNNLERIHKQVLSDPVIALDWLNIINEIKGLDIIPKSKWKVSARNYHTPDEIEQMASFLRQVRGMFFGHLRVKLEKDLTPEKRLSIETALRENPYGEVRVSNSKPGINLTRNSPLLSFRSKSRGPSPKPASVTSSLDNSAGDTGGVFTETPDSYGNMYASLPYIPQTSQTSQFYQGRSFRSLRSAGTENLHGTSIGKEFKTDNISLTPNPETVDPEPVEFVGQAGCSEQVNQPFSSEFIKVSNIFTVKTLKESESIKRCYVSLPTYCTSHTSGTPAKLMQFTGQKWKAVDDVVIVGQVACFNAIANEIYALGLDTSSIQDTIRYHLVCRTNFSGEKNLEIKISGDDRLSHIKTTDLGATEQRFVGEIGDEFNIKITSGSSVISDWRFSIRSQFEGVDKSVAVDWEAKMNSDNNVVCTIYKDETIVSQARFQNPPNNDRLPETSLYLQLLISKKATDQCLKYVAQSHASGKKLSTVSSKNDVILEGIDPGDKYTVYVYDGDELNGTCIGRFEIQTSKYIANCGGTMTVGTINLDFPEGAIHNQALVEVSSIVENPPDPPDGSVFVAPPMDFRSTQKKFAKHVTCKLMFPYITVHKSIEVDILCFENYEWQKVCSRQLTETKTLEFKCDHFTLYAVVTQMPYSVVKQIPLSYELCSYIYHDENDNFTGVTCLNHPRISHECHQLLSQSRYVQTPHLISPKEWQRLNGDATRYTLKCCDPDHTIGEWEVTLNQQFVQNGWRDLTELNNMVARLDNVLEIELMFKRNYGNNEKEWKRKVKYPLERNIKDPPPDMSGVNVFHNGRNIIKMGNVLVRPDN